jgi:serine protease Do
MLKNSKAVLAGLAAAVMLAGCSWRSAKPQTAVVGATAAAVPAALLRPLKAGDEVEYAVNDKFTGTRRVVTLRVDRVEATRVLFNQGARIEKLNGEPLQLSVLQAGDMDAMMPPGGWGRENLTAGATWSSSHRGNGAASDMAYSLKAQAGEPLTLQTPMGALPVVPIEYWGWATDKSRNISTPSKVSLQVWYSPELRRVIRMESNVKPATNLVPRTYESSRELIELVAIRQF